MKSQNIIIGIDEVGRGPLAGPVVVCALALIGKFRRLTIYPPLRDSKKLSAMQREAWARILAAHPSVVYALARVYPRMIDRINIREATNLAATRALSRLIAKRKSLIEKYRILLDGGIYINKGYLKPLLASGYTLNPMTVIGGDDTIPAIQLASIVAKVARDRFMGKLHKKFPQYGFAVHKGYGTSAHIKALKKYGHCEIHRRSFLKFMV